MQHQTATAKGQRTRTHTHTPHTPHYTHTRGGTSHAHGWQISPHGRMQHQTATTHAHTLHTHRAHTAHTHTHTRGGTSHAHTHTRVTNKSAQPHAAPDCQRKGKCALVLRPAKLRNKNKNHTSSFDITSDKGIDKTDCGGGCPNHVYGCALGSIIVGGLCVWFQVITEIAVEGWQFAAQSTMSS